MKNTQFFKGILGTAVSTVIALQGAVLPAFAAGSNSICYDFEDNTVSDWRIGSVKEEVSTLESVTEDGRTFARLRALPGSIFWAYNDRPNVTPDALLDLSDNPYVLGKNTETVISTSFRTNSLSESGKPRVTFSINYDDSGNANDTESNIYKRYANNYNVIWSLGGKNVSNYTHWNKDYSIPTAVNINNVYSENTWYNMEAHIWTDAEGKMNYVSMRVLDENRNQLGNAEVNINANNPLRQISQIENVGFEMMGRTGQTVTIADEGFNIDFDDFAVFNAADMKVFSIVKNVFTKSFSEFQIQLGTAPLKYELTITNEDGDELEYQAQFDSVTNIMNVTLEEPQASGEYYVTFNNGYINKDEVINVKATTTDDILFDFETGLNGWEQRNNISGVSLDSMSEDGRSFARISVNPGFNCNNWYPTSINTYPVAKIDLDKVYEFNADSTVVISCDVRSNDEKVFLKELKINNDKSDNGQNFNALWRWNGVNINNYSFTNDGTNGCGDWILDYGYPVGIRPNQASSSHYDGYNSMTVDTWYTVKIVYEIGENGTIIKSNYYLYNDEGECVDSMDKSNKIADSMKEHTGISRLGFELIGKNVQTAKLTTFDFDNLSIKSYKNADIINVVNANGEIQTTLTENTDYYASYKFFNDKIIDVNVDGIIALYEVLEDGTYKLTDVKLNSQTVTMGEAAVFKTSAINSQNGTVIKSFLWDSKTNSPICGCKTISK